MQRIGDKSLNFSSVYNYNPKTHWLEVQKTIQTGCDTRMGLHSFTVQNQGVEFLCQEIRGAWVEAQLEFNQRLSYHN